MVRAATFRPLDFDRTLHLAFAMLIALTAIAVFIPVASAGEEPPDITFRIVKFDCDEDPGEFPDGTIPEGCAPVEGVAFEILVEGETEPLTCATDADGRCQVEVPSEAMVTVTEDESTGTDGYAPLQNPIETQAVTEFAGARFINVPVEEPPTTDLPDTGAGQPVQPPVGLLSVVAVLLAVAGVLAGMYQARRGMR
jgi:hypothetical protein